MGVHMGQNAGLKKANAHKQIVDEFSSMITRMETWTKERQTEGDENL